MDYTLGKRYSWGSNRLAIEIVDASISELVISFTHSTKTIDSTQRILRDDFAFLCQIGYVNEIDALGVSSTKDYTVAKSSTDFARSILCND